MAARARPSPDRPTRQPRSAATRDRILAATEALLAAGDAEALTIEQVAERAHVSVGAIYKRFRGKDSLLPLVLERVHEQQFQHLRGMLAQPRWAGAGLGERIDGLLAAFADSQVARQRLIRALVVGYWQSPDQHGQAERSAELMATMHAWLLERAGEIRHPEPRLAISLGLFTTLQTLQSAIVLGRIPPELGLPRFVAEQARMFRAYLGIEGGAAAPPPA